jgi:C1A family cysteine protease
MIGDDIREDGRMCEDGDRGYDPTVQEPYPTEKPRFTDSLPSASIVNPAYLPPVGQQGTTANSGFPASCCAWASVYGLATFVAARAGQVDPSKPTGQASPAQPHIEALKKKSAKNGSCDGTAFSDYFPLLEKDGAPSMADAPYIPDCTSLWLAYQASLAKTRVEFRIKKPTAVKTSDLDSIKQVLASGRALCYGTRLFSDWKDYAGGDAPYWGNGDVIVSKKTGKPAGHCMLIVGYDDAAGALLIQNSEGCVWGIAGYVWMAYATFQFLAEGKALFVHD